MGLNFCDGFDNYSATANLTRTYRSIGSSWAWNATAGRNGGGSMQCSSPAAASTFFLPVNVQNVVNGAAGVAFWMKVSAIPASGTSFCWPLDSTDLGINNTWNGIIR